MEMKKLIFAQPSLSSLEDQLPEDLRGSVAPVPPVAPSLSKTNRAISFATLCNSGSSLDATGKDKGTDGVVCNDEPDKVVMDNLNSRVGRSDLCFAGNGKYYVVPIFWLLMTIPLLVESIMDMKYETVKYPWIRISRNSCFVVLSVFSLYFFYFQAKENVVKQNAVV